MITPRLVIVAAVGMLQAAALSAQVNILTTSLPSGIVGKLYAAGLSVGGGTAPYTWASTGSVPPGLTVASAGSVFGTPTATGSYNFVISVTDARQLSASRSFTVTIAGPSFAIATVSPLPSATAGQPYSLVLAASGGTSPYQWAATQGLPSGLALNSATGAIAGTPAVAGSFTLAIQVTDANRNTASASLALTVNAAALGITTVAPLFSATVGVAYSQTFSAAGGKPPYTWSILSGSTANLSLNATSGILQGTPQASGTLSFVVKVADSAGATASQSFSVVVNAPAVTINAGPPLPGGSVGVPYDQKIPASASGGTPPYTWSMSSGSVPGLNFDGSNLELSGTPATPGSFTFTLQVTDSASLSAARSFALSVAPASLTISTVRQLPNAALNAPYSPPALAASGGVPPYTWSAAGLPGGLSINAASGQIGGTPTAAGTFSPVVLTVTDSDLNHFSDNFTLTVTLPPAPAFTMTGLPETADPAQQYPLAVTLAAAYPTAISGQAVITFSPDLGPADNTILFSTGGTAASFVIPAGSTTATFLDANGNPVPQLQFQTGTAAGSITVSLRVSAGSNHTDITPQPAPSASSRIARAAPVVTSTQVTRTSNLIAIVIAGYSTAREVTQVTFQFAAASGQSLQSTASSITVDVSSLFGTWFGSSPQGSLFVFTQPFTVQGNPADVMPVSVTLTNRIGSTTAAIATQ